MIKISQTIGNIKRVNQIFTILSRNGFDNILEKIDFEGSFKLPIFNKKRKKRKRNLTKSQRIKKTIEELGPTFIKLAQMLSTRPDLISLELASEFEKLQDNVLPIHIDKITPILKEEFGKDIDKIFAKPLELLATASIGQVYKGELLDGKKVVVKVLKPNIDRIIKNDLDILKKIASLFDGSLVDYGVKSLLNIVKEFESIIMQELNFKLEAINIIRFYALFKDDKRIKVPKLYKEYSTKKIIVMEFIEGIKSSNIDRLNQYEIDKNLMAKWGFELLCEQIFKYKFFHADPHPGNLFVTYDSRVAFIDFGMMGSINDEEQKVLLRLIYHLTQRDEEKAALDILLMTNFSSDVNKDSFIKDMSNVVNSYMYATLEELEIKELFSDIVSLISKYDVSFKNDYYLFFKSIVTIEGVGRRLNPSFNAIEEIRPAITAFYREQLSFKNMFQKVKNLPKDLVDLLYYTPNAFKELIEQLKKGKFKIELQHIGLQEIESTIEKSFNRLTVSIIVASLLIGPSLILHAKTPPLIYNIPLFGIVGFSVASLMGIVLAYSIYKRGRL